MEIQTREDNGIVFIELAGEIVLGPAAGIKALVDKLLEEEKYRLIFNLEGVKHMDSSGIGVLINSLNRLKKVDGKMKLCNLSEPVRKIMELMKLPTLFSIYETEDEAIGSMMAS